VAVRCVLLVLFFLRRALTYTTNISSSGYENSLTFVNIDNISDVLD